MSDSLLVQRQSPQDYFGTGTASAGNGTTTVPTFVVARDNNMMPIMVCIIALLVILALVLVYMFERGK